MAADRWRVLTMTHSRATVTSRTCRAQPPIRRDVRQLSVTSRRAPCDCAEHEVVAALLRCCVFVCVVVVVVDDVVVFVVVVFS